MTQSGGFPLLTLILVVNGLGALTIWFVPARRVDTWRWLAFLIAATIFFTSLFLYMGWDNNSEGVQFVEGPVSWPAMPGFQYHPGIDGINLHLIMLITFSMPLILLNIWAQENKTHTAWLLTCETALLGALMILDLVGFVLTSSLALLAGTFALANAPHLGEESGKSSARTALTWPHLLLTGIAVVLLLVAVGGKAWTSNVWWAQTLQFWAIMAAMGIVSIGFPYQLGRIAVRQSLSPSSSMLIGGIFSVLGVYGILRFGVLALPLAASSFAPVMMLIGLFVAGWNTLAMVGTEGYEAVLLRWTACQVGLDMIGLFTLSQLGFLGVILRLIGRTLGLGVLLFPPQAHRQRLEQVLLVGGFLTALGMPGLAGFPGLSAWTMALLRWHWQANAAPWLNQAFDWGFYAVIALIWLLGGWTLLRVWHSLPHGDENPARTRQALIALSLLIVIVMFGLRPQPFINAADPTLHNALKQFNQELQEMLEKFVPAPESQNQMSAIGYVLRAG